MAIIEPLFLKKALKSSLSCVQKFNLLSTIHQDFKYRLIFIVSGWQATKAGSFNQFLCPERQSIVSPRNCYECCKKHETVSNLHRINFCVCFTFIQDLHMRGFISLGFIMLINFKKLSVSAFACAATSS